MITLQMSRHRLCRLCGALRETLKTHNKRVIPSFACYQTLAQICSCKRHCSLILKFSLKIMPWVIINNMKIMFVLRPALKSDRNGSCSGKISLNPQTFSYQIKFSTTAAALRRSQDSVYAPRTTSHPRPAPPQPPILLLPFVDLYPCALFRSI